MAGEERWVSEAGGRHWWAGAKHRCVIHGLHTPSRCFWQIQGPLRAISQGGDMTEGKVRRGFSCICFSIKICVRTNLPQQVL